MSPDLAGVEPRCEVVAVGDELLRGEITNRNAAWLGERLAAVGWRVVRSTAVGDDIEVVAAVLREALQRVPVVIVTGGLGPTQDDLTREAMAMAAGVELQRQPDLEAELLAHFATRGRSVPERNLRQADLPRGASALPNSAGTAPGVRLELAGGVVYALPGVPAEMHAMVSGHVLPDLARLCPSATPRVSVAVRTCGMWESEVAEAVAEVERRARSLGEPEVAFLASGGQTRVVLTGGSLEALQPWVQEVTGLLGDAVLLVDESVGVDPVALPAQVVALLLERGHSVAVAESVTAGLVTAALADVAGVSAVLRGGVTAYTPQIKGFVLHVGSLDQVVSQATATEMAQGVRALMDSDWAVATTGVAGPGPSNGVEAGTVHLAVAGPQGLLAHRELALPGDRGRVRLLATTAALDLLRRCLASAGLGNRAAGPVVVANLHPPPGRGLS